MGSQIFETYAVFDLETTGLPDANFNRANIIEFSVSTVSKQDLINSAQPRIQNKLTLVFNPRMAINHEAAEITGLDNYMLEYENSFDQNAAETIINFLKHLRGPVCLVAHNGNRFDFPMLKKAFEKLNLNLPDNIFCIDTYKAIPFIDQMRKHNEEYEKKMEETKEKLLDLEEEFLKEIPSKALDECYEITNELAKSTELRIDIQQLNETTPKRCIKGIIGTKGSHYISYEFRDEIRSSRSDILSNSDASSTPVNLEANHENVKIERKARRKLFKEENEIATVKSKTLKIPRSPRGYYTLPGIFERFFHKPKKAHHAGADVEMLEKIVLYYGKDFVDYSEANAVPFSEIRCTR